MICSKLLQLIYLMTFKFSKTDLFPSFFVGCKNDDNCRGDICHLLAAVSYLLHPHRGLPTTKQVEIHPAGLPGQLLAGNELDHVQPHHLLLSE